jgi:hypothetical protein
LAEAAGIRVATVAAMANDVNLRLHMWFSGLVVVFGSMSRGRWRPRAAPVA